MKLLVERLSEHDRVAIVVYAGESGLVLPSIAVANKPIILSAINQLHADGSTNGGSGIRLAYQVAGEHMIAGGVNRVVLCTDGDFNVGVTSQSELVRLIEEKAKSGVFLSVLGFGIGNYKDATMEKLADRGNGNYAYIDSREEAQKVLVEGLAGTLVTIAKDVKIQIDFNPARVAAYRLIGYENRLLRAEDFKDDKKDAGEIGAGHTVTALYEIVPAGQPFSAAGVDSSKYQQPVELTPAAATGELFTVRLRYKQPDGQVSQPLEVAATDDGLTFEAATTDFQFAACVAQFGMLLRNSKHRGDANYDRVLSVAAANVGPDLQGHRAEFLSMVSMACDVQRPMAQARR
jgi:Ca-activated chloride channel family protein